MTPRRIVCWFSCGDASAVACWLALRQWRDSTRVVVARIAISAEHSDNDRFAEDCARWFGSPITVLRSERYADTWDVWEQRRYIAGIAGAPCTTYLKKHVRFGFQEPGDLQVFGYTADETVRAQRFRETNLEIAASFPLIDSGLRKADCHALVRAAGIEVPLMYRLGFQNNNCIGCPKGGAGYWNKIREHFPGTFSRMAVLSRDLGARLVQQDGKRVYLDELRPDTGRSSDLRIECSPLCEPFVAEMQSNA